MLPFFTIVAITSPNFIKNEGISIVRIIESEQAHYVHIRKPGSTYLQMESLIRQIPEQYHDKLKIHDHFNLLNKFKLGGAHLNSRQIKAPEGEINLSKSCHSLEEIYDCNSYEYVFLSPIFDSISKTGYKSRFNLDYLRGKINDRNVIALGGVTPDKFPLLKKIGFSGAAMLGYFWN